MTHIPRGNLIFDLKSIILLYDYAKYFIDLKDLYSKEI